MIICFVVNEQIVCLQRIKNKKTVNNLGTILFLVCKCNFQMFQNIYYI